MEKNRPPNHPAPRIIVPPLDEVDAEEKGGFVFSITRGRRQSRRGKNQSLSGSFFRRRKISEKLISVPSVPFYDVVWW